MHPGFRSHAVTATLALSVCVAVAVVVVVVVAASAGAAAGSGATASDATSALDGDDRGTIDGERSDEAPRDGVGPLTRCFDGEGYPVSIGDEGATIDALVHLSVLTDPAVGNEFGVEAVGAIGGDPIVTLAAGVRLTAREAIADGVNPFAAFDVLYTYELRLPMFDGAVGDTEYRDEGSPITSAAGVVPC
ncbi:DUF7332 family protein [Halorubrum sp. DTA46]|uniref:DUF7332 family protein n=1 Tax=Halorubrum sp. DTA46 TaxID=3402162 RepID=UPI003AAD90F7